MRRDESGVTRCAVCGQALAIPRDAAIHFSIQGASGHPNERVLLVAGKEIHRCEVPRRVTEFYPGS